MSVFVKSETPSIFPTEGRWRWRWGCQQWQHLAVEQPWSRLLDRTWTWNAHLRAPLSAVTLLQDRLTDNAFTASPLWMSFKTGSYRKGGRAVLLLFCLHADRSKTGSSLLGLYCISVPTPSAFTVTICLLPSSSRKNHIHASFPHSHLCTSCRNEAASNSLCPSIPKPIYSMLFSVASLVGLLFTEGGREAEGWREKRRSRKEP